MIRIWVRAKICHRPTNVAYYLDDERKRKERRSESVCIIKKISTRPVYRQAHVRPYKVEVADAPLKCGYDPDDNKEESHACQNSTYPCIHVC
jgi:hypothetical protein